MHTHAHSRYYDDTNEGSDSARDGGGGDDPAALLARRYKIRSDKKDVGAGKMNSMMDFLMGCSYQSVRFTERTSEQRSSYKEKMIRDWGAHVL
jgi:hypothetical protein